jgi:peptidoglycan hydrolase-like protein with peptidoglycan-binding domain
MINFLKWVLGLDPKKEDSNRYRTGNNDVTVSGNIFDREDQPEGDLTVHQAVRERGEGLLKMKNVVGVGSGFKNGRTTPAVVVLVEKKVAESELETSDLVPPQIDGVVTDVVEVGELTPDKGKHHDKERPVYGGLSCIWEKGTACTLGAIVFKRGKAHALMNTHCVNPHWKGAEVGDEVRQPSPNDGGRNNDRIGNSTADYHHIEFGLGKYNPFDAGLARLYDHIEADALYQEGIGEISAKPRTAQVGELVRKSGRTTGVTETRVLVVNATVGVNYGTKEDPKIGYFKGQTIVENTDRHFGAGGDSSSLVLDADNNPVGLYFAGSSRTGIFSPIKPILDHFEISFVNEPYQKPAYEFTKTLKIGSFGDEVVELQAVLRKLGFFTYPTNTGYFGSVTEKAVREYQCARNIVCGGSVASTGWGQVGRMTRAALNAEDGKDTQSELLPAVDRACKALIEIAGIAGFPIKVTDAYRSFEEQDELYAIGRTKDPDKPVVTNAKGGESYHNFRVAFDVVFIDGEGGVSYEGEWDKLGRIGKLLGLEWGGDWSSFPDRPHFQMSKGHSTAAFRDGRVDLKEFD